MKKFLVLALVAMISATGFGKTIDEVFNAFPKADNVQEITVDKQMLGMAMVMAGDQNSGLSKMKDIDNLRIINIENPSSEQIAIAKELMKVEVDGFEEMLSANEDGQDVLILNQSEGQMITKMLIIASEKDKIAVVLIEGKIDLNDASKMMKIAK